MTATMAATPNIDKAGVYSKQAAQLSQIRKDLLLNAAASGEWETATVKTISRTQELTQAIQKQKLAARDYYKAIKTGSMASAIREQQALQNSFATQISGSAYGKSTVDLFVPKQFTSQLADARVAIGMHAQALSASSTQIQNWGKNTQWAGRQLMVGFTVPLGMAALGLGKLAYEADKNLTRIAKVYDTQSSNSIAQERELIALRENSLSTATVAAKQYGAAMSDILDVQAQLASTGLTGSDLQKTTSEVSRISFLGDLDYQQAIDMTIALQTAFGLSVDELTEKFNFMNQVENSTSLTIQDIAEATPRAASALSSLGVTVEEMTVLLTSMKESGVDAAEGANALKSATTRLLNPTAGAIAQFSKLRSATTGVGIDIDKIVNDAGGNLFDILKQLGKEMEGIDPLSKQKAIAELFGTYQFNRLNASLTNIGDALGGVESEANQTSKAIEVMGMDASSWANTAASEVAKMQQSASGRFKIAVESLKASLVPLGLTVLEALTPVIDALGNVVEWFNSWSDASKKTLLAILGIVGVAGPIVMLIGLVGNLIGSVGKGASAIGKLIARFTPMTAEQRAQQLMALRTNNIWDEQASSAAILSQSIDNLTRSMERNASAQGLMVNSKGQIGKRSIITNAKGQQIYGPGSINDAGKSIQNLKISAADAAMYAQMKQNTADMSQNTETMKRNWGGIVAGVASLAIGGVAMKDMVSGSNSLMDNLVNAAMIATSFTGLGLSFKGVGGILTKALSPLNNLFSGNKVGALGAKVADGLGRPFARVAESVSGSKGIVGGLGRVSGAIGKAIPTALRLFGPIGIIAGAVGILTTVADKMDNLEDKQKAINESAKSWSEILGYAYQQGSLESDKEDPNNDYAARIDDVKALREANSELVDALKEAKEEGGDFGKVYRLAMAEALKVVSTGGTAEQAKQAFGIALQAAGITDEQTFDNLMIRFNNVDLSNPEEIRSQLMQQIKDVYSGIATADVDAGFVRGIFGGDISGEARAIGTQAGQQFADAYLAASKPEEKRGLIFEMQGVIDSQMRPDFTKLQKDYGKAFEDLGITSMQQLAYAMKNKEAAVTGALNRAYGEAGIQAFSVLEGTMDKYQEMMDVFFQSFGDRYGLDSDTIEYLKNDLAGVGGLIDYLGLQTGGAAGAAKDLEWAWTGVFGAIETAAAAVVGFDRNSARADAAQVTSALQSSYSATSSDIFDEANRLLDNQFSAQIDSIQDAGKRSQKGYEDAADRAEAGFKQQEKDLDNSFDARQKQLDNYWKAADKNFENRWEGTMEAEEKSFDDRIDRAKAEAEAVDAAYDARIKSVENAIDVEQDAEDTRNKIFEAEERRIERMAERFNTNIDFNTALNSGSLDEAARIMNNAGAQEAQWGLEDQQRSEEEASEARIDAYEAEIEAIREQQQARADSFDDYIDRLNDEKDARLDLLRDIQEAEKDAMQEQKEMQQEALAAEREMQSERLANARETEMARLNAAKQADADATNSKVTHTQRQQEAARRALDMELRALREFVPTNEQELRDHIGRIQDVYFKYGLNLQGQGNAWGQFIGSALSANVSAASARISNDIAWDQIGQQITARMANGTGVSINDLRFFLQNGRFPRQGLGPGSIADILMGVSQGTIKHTGGVVRHNGGDLGFSQADRVGIQRSAGVMPSEVPAILKRGEFVVNEKATRDHRGLLEQINNRSLPKERSMISRHDGGGVGGGTQTIGAAFGAMLSRAADDGIASYILQGISSAVASSTGGAGLSGGSFIQNSGRYPKAVKGVVSANTAAGAAYIKQRWGLGSGTLGDRPNKSDHPMGKASDTMIPNYKSSAGIALGNQIASYFVSNPAAFGTKYVIWRDQINEGRGWTRYGHPNAPSGNGGDTLQHRDHVHVSYLHKGGQAGIEMPSLMNGGEVLYDNTVANLHKKETVLTAPLSRSLEQGIENISGNGGRGIDHLTIDLRGSTIRDDDIERIKAVVRELNKEATLNVGKTRKVTS